MLFYRPIFYNLNFNFFIFCEKFKVVHIYIYMCIHADTPPLCVLPCRRWCANNAHHQVGGLACYNEVGGCASWCHTCWIGSDRGTRLIGHHHTPMAAGRRGVWGQPSTDSMDWPYTHSDLRKIFSRHRKGEPTS